MNSVRVLAFAGGLVALGAAGAIAGHGARSTARVVTATARTHTIDVPHEECRDVEVTRQKPVRDPNRIAGTGIGAALGGVLGHQIGRGRGNTLATIAGAAAGGFAGNQAQGYEQRNDVETHVEHQCTTVVDKHEEPAGYDVVYDYGGQRHHVHVDHDPGSTLPVVDGKVVTAPKTGHG